MPLAEDIVNRALDAAGSELVIGDLQENSREAQVCLRSYAPCLEQLSRSAHWDALRMQAPLTMLADATGQTPNVGNLVQLPWTYCYAYPIDCLKARFIPWNNYQNGSQIPAGNIEIPPSVPLMTGLGSPPIAPARIRPARFVVGVDTNYPAVTAAPTWDQQVQWWEVQGISPTARTVIMTNVKWAQLIYTGLIPYPNMWDALFQEAMVALLAARIAMPLAKDKKLGAALRAQNIQIAEKTISQARVTDGNEGWSNSDFSTDWMRARNVGGGGRGFDGGGPGVLGYGWDSCSFDSGNSSAY